MQYEEVYSKESSGGLYGNFGINVQVASQFVGVVYADTVPNKVRIAIYKACEEIEAAIMEAGLATDETALDHAREERADIVALFEEPIYVEEIPNGYCSKWCCKHLPWFVVTTKVGRIKVGWRKRVLSIDWSDSLVTHTADQLFPNEDVTKGRRLIHAWTMEKAKLYLNTVIQAGDGKGAVIIH